MMKHICGTVVAIYLLFGASIVLYGLPFAPYASYSTVDEGKLTGPISRFPNDEYSRSDYRYGTFTTYFMGVTFWPYNKLLPKYIDNHPKQKNFINRVFTIALYRSFLLCLFGFCLYAILRWARLDASHALLAAAMALAHVLAPAYLEQSGVVLPNILMGWLAAFSLWALITAIDEERLSRRLWYLCLAAWLGGLAVGSKYLAAPLLLSGLVAIWQLKTRSVLAKIPYAFLFALVMGLSFVSVVPGIIVDTKEFFDSIHYERIRTLVCATSIVNLLTIHSLKMYPVHFFYSLGPSYLICFSFLSFCLVRFRRQLPLSKLFVIAVFLISYMGIVRGAACGRYVATLFPCSLLASILILKPIATSLREHPWGAHVSRLAMFMIACSLVTSVLQIQGLYLGDTRYKAAIHLKEHGPVSVGAFLGHGWRLPTNQGGYQAATSKSKFIVTTSLEKYPAAGWENVIFKQDFADMKAVAMLGPNNHVEKGEESWHGAKANPVNLDGWQYYWYQNEAPSPEDMALVRELMLAEDGKSDRFFLEARYAAQYIIPPATMPPAPTIQIFRAK